MYQWSSSAGNHLLPATSVARHYELDDDAGTASQFSPLLDLFRPINLDQMERTALLSRIDTKYLLHTHQLYQVLAELIDHYYVLEINCVRLSSYQTLYFDSDDFSLYLAHHAGRPKRFKVRSRRYIDSNRSFFEVKLKTGQGRTIKRRMETSKLVTSLDAATAGFLAASVQNGAQDLEPKLWNGFSRITLVSRDAPERLTLDLNLRFDDGRWSIVLPGAVIAEVKQEGRNRSSAFIQRMRLDNFRPTRFSKYCVGVSLLYPRLKCNNFKPQLRRLYHVTGGYDDGR